MVTVELAAFGGKVSWSWSGWMRRGRDHRRLASGAAPKAPCAVAADRRRTLLDASHGPLRAAFGAHAQGVWGSVEVLELGLGRMNGRLRQGKSRWPDSYPDTPETDEPGG